MLARWLVTILIAPLAAQPEPVPSESSLAAARPAVLDLMTELAVGSWQGAGVVAHLRERAARATEPAVRYLLLERALRGAEQLGDVAAAMQVVGAMKSAFAIDGPAVRLRSLGQLAARHGVPALAVLEAYRELAVALAEAGDPARGRAVLASALENVTADVGLRAWIGREARELEALALARKQLGDAQAGPAWGRYLCLQRGDFAGGEPLLAGSPEPLLARLGAFKARAPTDAPSAMAAAESWLTLAGGELSPHALRNARRRALDWYRVALPLTTGLENGRVLAHMSRIEDDLGAEAGPGHLRFDRSAAMDALVITGGHWRVSAGRLVGRNTGEETRATLRRAYRSIRSVCLRCGISGLDDLNLRLAIGDFNVLFNWEVRPENHFYYRDHLTVTKPRLLVRGVEHDLRVRQLGCTILVHLDGRLLYEGTGTLAGTVTVYPALGSEIFVSSLAVEGELAPDVEVRGPDGLCR